MVYGSISIDSQPVLIVHHVSFPFSAFGFSSISYLIRIPVRLLFLVLCKVTVKLSDVDPYRYQLNRKQFIFVSSKWNSRNEFKFRRQLLMSLVHLSFRKPLIYHQLSWHSENTCTILSILITTNGFQVKRGINVFFSLLFKFWMGYIKCWLIQNFVDAWGIIFFYFLFGFRVSFGDNYRGVIISEKNIPEIKSGKYTAKQKAIKIALYVFNVKAQMSRLNISNVSVFFYFYFRYFFVYFENFSLRPTNNAKNIVITFI